MKNLLLLFFMAFSMLFVSCVTIRHGILIEKSTVDSFIVGKSIKSEVVGKLGIPTSESTFQYNNTITNTITYTGSIAVSYGHVEGTYAMFSFVRDTLTSKNYSKSTTGYN